MLDGLERFFDRREKALDVAEKALDRIEHMLDGTKPSRRNLAVALSLFDDSAAVPVLRRGLRSSDWHKRWESASCLAGYADPATSRQVLRLYRHEKHSDIRCEMVRALEGVGTAEVEGFFRRKVRDRDPEVRSAAAQVLAATFNGRSRAYLQQRRRRETDREVRRVISEALTHADRAVV